MARFQINKYHQIMYANDINELSTMAKEGMLHPSDLVQPEGTSEWLYAGELPKIKDDIIYDPSLEDKPKTYKIPGITLLLLSVGLFFQAYQYQQQIPSASDLEFIGSNGLQEDQAMLTDSSKLYKEANAKQSVGLLDKNSVITLKDKKGEFFLVDSDKGSGWISMYDIAPAYLFAGKEIKNKYDARFNAHRKILPFSASWERPVYGSDLTLFFLKLQNTTPYTVEDIVVKLELKDDKGNVVQVEKIEVEGKILAGDTSQIGTLTPPKKGPNKDDKTKILTISRLEELEKQDPSITERWIDSIEMHFGKGKLSGATVTITQANTVFKK